MTHKKASLKKKLPLQSPNASDNPFRQRFGCDFGLDFAFMCPGMPFSGDTDRKRSLGGSETACLQLARAISDLGNQVMVYCNTQEEGNYNGIEFIHAGDNGENWRDFSTSIPHDISVIQRVPLAVGTPNASRMTWLWQHDLLLKPSVTQLHSAQWQMDRLVVPSTYMKRQYQEVGGIEDDAFFVTTNGLDYGLINDALKQPPKRDPKRLAYAARPERGLEILLGAVMPKLLERDPSYVLHVYGYDNPVTHLQGLYANLRILAERLGSNCVWHSPLAKPELYREYLRAGAYVYPTNFLEISCITAMECMSLGLPFISSRIGALPETLHPDAAVLLSAQDVGVEEGKPVNVYESVSYARTPEYISRFVDEIMSVTRNVDVRNKMAQAGRSYAKRYSWENVAVSWVQEALSMFDAWTANKGRLARHFWWVGDHCAASKLWASDALSEEEIESAMDLEDRLQLKDFLLDDTKRAKYYNKIATPGPGVAYHAWNEARYKYLLDWLNGQLKEGKIPATASILDFGCAHGGYSVGMLREFPETSVVGVDIAKRCIEVAKEFAIEHKVEDRAEFVVGDENTEPLPKPSPAPFDVLVCFDVLEHVPDPMGYLSSIMRHVKDDGWVIISVPHGNGDVTSERVAGILGCHLHSFDRHCIRDLFSQQKSWKWAFLGGARSQLDNSPQGWYISMFQKSDIPFGEINWKRKTTIQAPRQTVSGHIISFNSEAMIGRAIRSILPYCDEIDILDTGSTDKTQEIAERHYCRFHEGRTNPLRDGFETARNEGLAYARGDWILWIDTDEELCNGINLPKYLRHSTLAGFSIRQHHLSIEPPNAFNPDLPVRVFRRTWPDDKPSGLLWYGMIHEHVELGINESIGSSLVLTDVDIAHDGYFTEAIRRNRFARNFGMVLADRTRYPDRKLGAFVELRDCCHISRYLMRDPSLLLNNAIQQYFGMINSNGLALPIRTVQEAQLLVYKRCVQLYETEILPLSGIPGNMTSEALEYYTEACRFLGLGVDWTLAIQANSQGPAQRLQPDNIVHARFTNKDALAKYVLTRIHSQNEPFEGPFA